MYLSHNIIALGPMGRDHRAIIINRFINSHRYDPPIHGVCIGQEDILSLYVLPVCMYICMC